LLSHSSGFPDMAPVPKYQDLSEDEAKATVFNRDYALGI
jgi:CubicO group peptidase (beta-lactamase class C family)